MPCLDKFDIVLAIHILHYAKSKGQLLEMCNKISENTVNTGKFIAIIMNPEYDFKKQNMYPKKQYRTIFNKENTPKDEEPYKLIMSSASGIVELDLTYFTKKTYIEVLKKSGLKKINFCNVTVTKEGIEKYGFESWREHLENPKYIIIECLLE